MKNTPRRFALFRILLGAVGLCGLVAVSFGAGVYTAAERTAFFYAVKDARTTIGGYFTASAAEPAAPKADKEVILYDRSSIRLAQSESKPPQDMDEWTGFYRIATTEKDLLGRHPVNAWLPPVIGARLQPWAKAKMEATNGVADDTGQICQPTGLFRTTGFSGSFMFLPGRDKIVMIYGAIDTAGVQRVYMNRAHPTHLLPTWNGDSVGYWEGDTLVVDTVGFNDRSWLHPTMEPHTEEAQLVQHIRRVANGELIEVHYTVSDRVALTSAYTYTRYYKKAGLDMPEDICNDDLDEWRQFRNDALRRELQRARRVE